MRVRRVSGPWTVPTFAPSTEGDVVDGEDLVVRRAAVEALGPYNGAVVAVDPASGRILTMVNQKLALTGSFQPCSTVKLYVALAALSEGIIARDTVLAAEQPGADEPDRRAGPFQQSVLRDAGREARLRALRLLRACSGWARERGSIWKEGTRPLRGSASQERRHVDDGQFRGGYRADAAATGCFSGRVGQRRHSLLPAMAALAARDRQNSCLASNASSTSLAGFPP